MAKTFKREVAIAILLYLFYLGIYGDPIIVEAVVWPFMLYVGAAFGMDWARSQLNEVNKGAISFGLGRGVQSNGYSQEQTNGEHQRPSRQREQSERGSELSVRGSELVESSD